MAYALAHKGKATAPEVTYNPADGPEAYTMNSLHSWPWCAWDCEENTKMITSNEN